MKCPVDNATLVMSDKQGIEIDYCPECRGVWLDRGELDKIIDRSALPAPAAPEPQRPSQPEPYRQEYRDDRKYDNRGDHHHKKHKKENFLGDLFDF